MRPAVPVTLEPAVPMPVPAKWPAAPIAAVRAIRYLIFYHTTETKALSCSYLTILLL